MRKPIVWLLTGALLGGPAVAGADIYKWTDSRGAISYGEKPPEGARNVTRLTMEGGNVSVIPRPKVRPAALPQDVASTEARTVRLGVDDITRLSRWREQCVAERRVDCDNPTPATFDHAPSFARNILP
jgi:hypothetical protein